MRKLLFTICALLLTTFTMAQEETMSNALSLYKYAENNKYDDNAKGYYLKAYILLEKAVNEGYGEAAYLLGDILQGCKAGVRDQEKTFELYKKSVELGYEAKDVELRLGDICVLWEKAANRKEMYTMAFNYYSKSQARGHSDACYRLAMCYYYGLGVEKDEAKAFSLCRNFLVDKGNRNEESDIYEDRYYAYINIYKMLANFCLDKNYELQANGFRISTPKVRVQTACEMLRNAQYNPMLFRAAKIMYENQKVVSFGNDYYKNLASAIDGGLDGADLQYAYYIYADYDETAAETGEYAGGDYIDSYGEETGLSKVAALTNSAKLGYIPAMQLLGDWYESGRYVSKNLVKAKEWHDMAIKEKERKENADTVSANLSPIQQAVSDIQCPKALIMTNNGNVNVRQQPNAKAKRVGYIEGDCVHDVIEEQNGWYKVPYYYYDENTDQQYLRAGWVRGTVTHNTDSRPITADMQNDAYGYVDTQDPDAMEDETYMHRVYIRPDEVCVAWVGNTFEGTLFLDRYVNNVCCMKYGVYCGLEQYSEESGNLEGMKSIVKNGNKATGLWIENNSEWIRFVYGSNYAIKLKERQTGYDSTTLDLSIFNDDTLLLLFFSNKINSNETFPTYISSALLSGKYMTNH